MIGSVVGVSLIALRRRAWSSRIPYGPYIALAAAVWIFTSARVLRWWQGFPTMGP
jgi:leader peptidase (prepilin peptidase)/N-methyltransferase